MGYEFSEDREDLFFRQNWRVDKIQRMILEEKRRKKENNKK
jgi:hypothetical protein